MIGAMTSAGAGDESKSGQDRTDSGWTINAYGGLLSVPITGLVVAVFVAVWGADPLIDAATYLYELGIDRALPPLLVTLAVAAVWAWGHEFVHAAAYCLLTGGSRTDVRIGFNRKAMHLCAHYRRSVPARKYRWVTAMPGFVLGVLPWMLAVVTGNVVALLTGWFGLIGAASDLAILLRLRGVARTTLIADAADRPGCRVLP